MSRITRSSRSLALGLAILVAAATAAVFVQADSRALTEAEAWKSEQADIAAEVIGGRLERVFANLDAIAAFVEETHPDQQSFVSYAERLGATNDTVGIGYATEVHTVDLDEYFAALGEEREFFGISDDGSLYPIELDERPTIYPVEAFASGPMLLTLGAGFDDVALLPSGLEAGASTTWRDDIARALDSGDNLVSQFTPIVINDIAIEGAFFAAVPVATQRGTGRGLVIAMMVEPLLLTNLDSQLLANVNWEVFGPDSEPTRFSHEETTIHALEVPGATWSLALAPTEEAQREIARTPAWQLGLATALVGSVIAGAIWLFTDRRNQRRRAARFERVARDKDRFLAAVSHELRTPLTAVAGIATELHDQGAILSAADRDSLTRILSEQTDELTDIVEDLLVAARNDIGQVALHIREMRIVRSMQRSIDSIGLAVTHSGEPGIAVADPQRVRQIFRNLLTNAQRYGGPLIQIQYSSEPGWVDTVVADNGNGIPPGQEDLIFQAYESVHTPTSRIQSIGLGLYVSRALARAMGGDLTYVHEDGWSRFCLRLPASSRPHEERPGEEDEHERVPPNIT